jgi:predicted Fe-S protein YdhL (DUF1289 family)
MSQPEISSPCIRNCCLDDRDICVGCYRSLDEIKQWQRASTEDKKRMLVNIEQRKRDNSRASS